MDDRSPLPPVRPVRRRRGPLWVMAIVVGMLLLPFLWPLRPLTGTERRLIGTWRSDIPHGWTLEYRFATNRVCERRRGFLYQGEPIVVPQSMRARDTAPWSSAGSELRCGWDGPFPATLWGRIQVSINQRLKSDLFRPIDTSSIVFQDDDHILMGKEPYVRIDRTAPVLEPAPDAPPQLSKRTNRRAPRAVKTF